MGENFKGSPTLLLFICVLIWSADIGAYIFGRMYGKVKLVKNVSPNKTWEGVFGSFILGGFTLFIIISMTNAYYMDSHLNLFIALIGLISVVFSIIGDLFESLFKRSQGLKDSGYLLPGHGGILDRIDSLLPVFPVVLFLV